MTKRLTLLLFIGLAWGQENTDRLILRNGSKFSGKYLGIIFGGNEIFGGVKFETVDKKIVKPPIKSIQKLSINALTIINNGQWVVEKDFVKISEGNINQQSYDNYQQDYQQGVTAAKKDWADSQSGPRWDSKDLTDTRAPGFIDGYKKEMAKMAKLKFKGNVIKSATTGCVIYYLFYELHIHHLLY